MEKLKEALNKDVKEYNLKLLIIFGVIFITLMGFISYKLTNKSYALFTDEVEGTKTLTLHYEAPKTVTFDPDGGIIPAGTDWTGSGNSATKEVSKGLKYGELPEPTKEGYTFKGWNGKNMLNLSDETRVGVAWDNSNNSARAVTYAKVKPNTQYTISFEDISDFSGIYSFEKANQNDNTATVSIQQITNTKTITTAANTNYLGIQFNKTNIALNDIEKIKIQIEENATATEYEPYYITEDTKVVQISNHTLKAIWEEEEETQTEP